MSTISGSQSRSSRVTSSAAEVRFNRILVASKKRLIRRLLFSFFSYLSIVATCHPVYLIVFEVWRILQWCLPCLIPGSPVLYEKGTTSQQFVGVLSIMTRIVPSFVDASYFIIWGSVYIAVLVIFSGIFCIALFQFSKNAMISRPLALFIAGFLEGPWILIQPMVMNMTGDQIGRIFILEKDLGNAGAWIVLVLIVALYCGFGLMQEHFVSVSLSFRPTTLASFCPFLQSIIVHMTSAICFLSGILPYCPRAGRVVCYILMMLMYLSNFISLRLSGNLIRSYTRLCLDAGSVSSVCVLIVCMVFDLIDRVITPIILFVFVILFGIVILIFFLVSRKATLKVQTVLDRLSENPELFDEEIKSVFKALNIACQGYALGHPLVVSWKFMRMITDRWQYSWAVWLVWARFVCSFPGENRLLLWIDDQMQRFVYHTGSVAHIRAQIHSVVQRREVSMTSALKHRVAECMRQMIMAKGRMCGFWECVSQGNPLDMEAAAVSAKIAIDETDSMIQHLLRMYPNNQYATRAYLQFLEAVKADPVEIQKWRENYQTLKIGQTVSPDIPQQQAVAHFPALLSVAVFKQSNQPENIIGDGMATHNAAMTTTATATGDGKADNISPMLASIRSSIYGLSIPATTCATIMITVFFLVVFGAFFPTVMVLTQQRYGNCVDLMNITSQASHLRVSLTHLTFMSVEFLTRQLGLEPVTPMREPLDNLTERIRLVIADLDKTVNALRTLNELRSRGDRLEKAYQILFESSCSYPVYSVTTYPDYKTTVNKKSVESQVIAAKLSASTISHLKDADVSDYIETEQLANMVSNQLLTTRYITESCTQMITHITDVVDRMTWVETIGCVIVACIVLLVDIFMISFLAHKINSNKRATAKCFLMIPKHVVNSVISSFKQNGLGGGEDDSNDELLDGAKNRQEESFLGSLYSADTSRWAVYGSVALFSIAQCMIMIVSIILTALIMLRSSYTSGVFCKDAAPVNNLFVLPYTDMVLSILDVYLLALFDAGHEVIALPRETLIDNGTTALYTAIDLAEASALGNGKIGINPLSLFSPEFVTTGFDRSNSTNISTDGGLVDLVLNMSPSHRYHMYSQAILRALMNAKDNPPLTLNGNYMSTLWDVMYHHFYESYLEPSAKEMPIITKESFLDISKISILLYVVMYVLAGLFFIMALVKIFGINQSIRWIITIIMQCPSDVLIASEPVMQILSGSFQEKKVKDPSLSHGFCSSTMSCMDNAVIVADPDTSITWVSQATKDMFGLDFDELTSTTFRDLLIGPTVRGHDSSIDEFLNDMDVALSGRAPMSFWRVVKYLRNDGSVAYLQIGVFAFTKKGIISSVVSKGKLAYLSFIVRDMTQEKEVEQAMNEERRHTEHLLLSIIPGPLVSTMEETHTNEVSISAPSASIIFMNLVGFSSMTTTSSASQVVTVLSRVFAEFDNIISKYPAMTKIKCLGDTYIAAGGLFALANQPDHHAKECIKFGADCVQRLHHLTPELGLSLKMRVGINTGGPVIGGVMDAHMPTFTLIGSTIDDAQELERTGVPMMIHISRYVYELIFGANLKVKEAGEIITKNGTMITYLIDPM